MAGPAYQPFEEAGFGWATDKRGRFYGAFGIRLRASDMANFGQLFLDGGRSNGQQLVPEAWVRKATTRIELARYADPGGTLEHVYDSGGRGPGEERR